MTEEAGGRSRDVKELHVAPMLDVTYRDFRYLARLLTKRAVLWTEMVVDDTLVFGDTDMVKNHYLEFDEAEHPLICQIGSSGYNLEWTEDASKKVRDAGYDEINLNAECPSNKVAVRRQFGAALMKKPDISASILNTMRCVEHDIPVSIKVRIAIDEIDAEDFLYDYIKHLIEECGCHRFYLHSRKVYTDGRYRPLQNRNVPPLNFPSVYNVCRQFPDCDFWINGGIRTIEHAKAICFGEPMHGESCEGESVVQPGHGSFPCKLCNESNGSCIAPPSPVPPNLRGCLIGRAAMENPAVLADVDRYFYGDECNPAQNRRQVLLRYADYLSRRYPKRCCDSDPRVSTVNVPIISDLIHDRWCQICGTESDNVDDDRADLRDLRIAKPVIDLAMKPVLGMFYGVKGGQKRWRQICHEVSCDDHIRNCGPAYVLRKAVDQMNPFLLDKEFELCSDEPKGDVNSNLIVNDDDV
jgi:tRNA-dihydrouridine synthase A